MHIVMVVVAMIDRGGGTTEKPATIPRNEVHDVGRPMVRMLRGEEPGEPQDAASEEFGTERRRPMRIPLKQRPGDIDERT